MVLIQVIVAGLLIGSVYALFSSGLTLVWGMMNVINFAHASGTAWELRDGNTAINYSMESCQWYIAAHQMGFKLAQLD